MTADTVGGVWTYAMELCGGLASSGVRVVLATMGAPLSAAQWAEVRALPGVVVEQSTFRLEWMPAPWLDVDQSGRWLRELARRHVPDVLHLNGYAHASLPFGVPVVVVAHSDVLTWWKAVHGTAAPSQWDRYRAAVRAGVRSADLVVAPTAAMLHELQQCYGGLPHTRVIANGRSRQAFAPASKAPMILAAGRLWDEGKNIAALCEAADGLPWPVCVAGHRRGPHGGERGLHNVRVLGALDSAAMSGWMGRAAIFAHPARYEPFGLCALEAALSGCTLVLADIPTLREVWGDAAIYVRPDDTSALRSALVGLIAQPERRRQLARRAARRAARYSPEAMTAGYLDAYRSVGVPLGGETEVAACAS